MGKSVLITSGKGGVGKSTLAVSLAAAFSSRGLSTVLIDGDIGLRCADLLLGVQDRVVMDMEDVLEERCPLADALFEVQGFGDGRLCLLPASQALRAAQVRHKDMIRLTDRLRKTFDVVLLDGPAGIGRNFKLLLGCADTAIVVSTLDAVALRDAEKTASVLDADGLGHPYLVLNRVRAEYVRSGLAQEPQAIADRLDMPLLGIIPDSDRIYPGLLKGLHPYQCGDRALTGAFDRTAARFLGEDVPFPKMSFSPVYRFFHRSWGEGGNSV